MSKKDIYILGVGHNTIVYIDLVENCGYNVVGLYNYNSDRVGEEYYGFPIVGSNYDLFANDSLADTYFAISVGNNRIRQDLAQKIRLKGGIIPSIIHPSSVISKYAEVDQGVVIHANSVVQASAKIARDTYISCNVSIAHDVTVGESCYLAFGTIVGAYIEVEDLAFIGQGAILISGKANRVGHNAIIGAGAVVTKEVLSNTIVIGNPARLLNNVDSLIF